MSKHTPGPWTASIQRSRGGADLGWIVEFSGGRIGWASLSYSESGLDADASDPAREANARLIAAAPDLLDTLKWLNRIGGLGLDVHARIDAALAKAEGA